jgi:uncharacterized protein YkwD
MRLRRCFVLLALLLAVAVPAQLATSQQASAIRPRAVLLRWINQARLDHGIRKIGMIDVLALRAARHSADMARVRRLFHSSRLYAKVARWNPRCWGETIGVGPTAPAVYRAWMRSAPHRRILLASRYRQIGIGIAVARGNWWITAIVYG